MTTRLSRRTLVRWLALSAPGLLTLSLTACTSTVLTAAPTDAPVASADAPPGSAIGAAPAQTATPTPAPQTALQPAAPATSGSAAGTSPPAQTSTPGPARTVAVPATPTELPPPPVPTATPRPRPVSAMLNVPYYTQRIGRENYCLPTSIAMVADRYGRLPRAVAGTPDLAPRYVADVAYRAARDRVAGLGDNDFQQLRADIGTDPLQDQIWNVFAANGRDLAAGMSPALAYLVLVYAFELTPVLGTLDECMVALSDNVPSILFGRYGELRRADGILPNVGGYAGDHAFVLVGIDHERLLINDPLPSDKLPFSGREDSSTASQRAVTFDLPSVRRMTRGDGDTSRGDLFMMPPPGIDYSP
jgi:hypothetical protein